MSEQHGPSYCIECHDYFWTPTCGHEDRKQVSNFTGISKDELKQLIKSDLWRYWLDSDLEDWQGEMRDLHILYHSIFTEEDNKTNFESYLEEQLKNPQVREAFEEKNNEPDGMAYTDLSKPIRLTPTEWEKLTKELDGDNK